MLEGRLRREGKMSKRIVSILLYSIFLLEIIFSQSTSQEIEKLLQSTEWGPDSGMAGTYLKFNDDGTITSRTNFEGAYKLIAKYRVVSNRVIMTIEQEEKKYRPPIEIEFALKNDDSSLVYSQCLVSISGSKYERKYWNQSSRSKETKKVINGENVIIKRSTIRLFENMQFYANPKFDAKKYMIFDYENSYSGNTMSPSMVKHFKEINIIGYLEKDKEWLLVLKPIPYGSYYEMKVDIIDKRVNYCWIKHSEISF
jgi:hypothetical protein